MQRSIETKRQPFSLGAGLALFSAVLFGASTPLAKVLLGSIAIRLAILYIAATTIVVGILVYRAYDTAGTLNDRELSLRAADLAQFVKVDLTGAAHLDLPPKLSATYEAAGGADIFAIRGSGGLIIAASPSNFGDLVRGWPDATDDPSYFRLKDFGSGAQSYVWFRRSDQRAKRSNEQDAPIAQVRSRRFTDLLPCTFTLSQALAV